MYKLGTEEAEEPEIKLPTLAGSWRNQGSSRKTSSASLITLKYLTVYVYHCDNKKVINQLFLSEDFKVAFAFQ